VLKQLEQTILEENLIGRGDTIIVAVSGGPDSIALLHGLCQLQSRYQWNVVAAHLNHGFRGKDADEDACYVERIAASLKIPSYIKKINVPQWMKEWGLGPQEAARILRYGFLREIAGQFSRSIIATAHQGDDQVETILMRIIRGTGLEGLAGIPMKRMEEGIPLIRPMLRISRSDIENYCMEHHLQPRLDPSNLSGKYTRNRIRLEIVPLIKKENPEIMQSITQLSSLIQHENDFMDSLAKDHLSGIIVNQELNKIIIRQKEFLSFHLALQRRMIKLILSYLTGKSKQIQFKHIEDCRRIMYSSSPSASLDLPGTIKVHREYGHVIFSLGNVSETHTPYVYPLPVPGRVYVPEIGRTFFTTLIKGDFHSHDITPDQILLDPKGIKGDLFIRSRKPGDRINILGMAGSKKIKDLFIDEKIPRLQRDRIPLLTDEEKVLWIPKIRKSTVSLTSLEGKEGLLVEMQ
jgi:tRNA(Ile)-lysidine synthase